MRTSEMQEGESTELVVITVIQREDKDVRWMSLCHRFLRDTWRGTGRERLRGVTVVM